MCGIAGILRPRDQAMRAARAMHATLAFEVFMFNKDGGRGTQVTKAKPSNNEGFENRHNVLDAIVSPDGRYLYFSSKSGTTWTDKEPPQWQISRRDAIWTVSRVSQWGQRAIQAQSWHSSAAA